MTRLHTPRICIEGSEVSFISGKYNNNGNLTASQLSFNVPLTYGGLKKLWNKEVTFFLSEHDSIPIFRGWIKRTQITLNQVNIIAQDIIGYMLLGGDSSEAKIPLTDTINLDGLTVGGAMKEAIRMANLESKLGTDMIGDTTPHISSSRPPLRGTLSILDILKQLTSRAIDRSGTLPRPNIARVVDDGSKSQLVIELESSLDGNPVHTFSENKNITSVNIINRKVPTIVVVNGANGVKGEYKHDSAMAAYDRNFLEVSNDSLKSPAECKDFAYEIFKANLHVQYEYAIKVTDGAFLSENDIIRVETDKKEFNGNYRVIGKMVDFGSSFSIGVTLNRKPPTLAQYIKRQDS